MTATGAFIGEKAQVLKKYTDNSIMIIQDITSFTLVLLLGVVKRTFC